MRFRKLPFLMNDAGDGGTGGGAADPGAGGGQPGGQGDPGAGGQPGAGGESLLKKPGEGGAEYGWLPEKYRVVGADGKLDLDASGKKMGEGLSAAVKRIGSGDVPPASAADYKFDGGEKFKDVKFDDALSNSFRERAHKLGLSNAQYQGVMEAHLEMVSPVLDSILKLSVAETKAELQKVWPDAKQFEDGLADAQRWIDSMPEALGTQAWERFGRDPVFMQMAALVGKEMREDKPAGQQTGGGAAPAEVEALMKSDAYRNPKHADHTKVSAQVRAHFEKVGGTQAALQ